jgi:hypothetical protein
MNAPPLAQPLNMEETTTGMGMTLWFAGHQERARAPLHSVRRVDCRM